jgi:hypothetical protein
MKGACFDVPIKYNFKIYTKKHVGMNQGVTKRCRLSLLTNSALVYESKCGEMGGSCGVSANEYNCAHHVTWSPSKLWRSTSIFNLWGQPKTRAQVEGGPQVKYICINGLKISLSAELEIRDIQNSYSRAIVF